MKFSKVGRAVRRRGLDDPGRFGIAGFACFLLLTSFSFGISTITLKWEPPSKADIGGYKIYMGHASGSYGASFNVGKVTSFTISQVALDREYYFVATSYDSRGIESEFSKEVRAFAGAEISVSEVATHEGGPFADNRAVPGSSSFIDSDGDGIPDSQEYVYWGTLYTADSDGDGIINGNDYDSDNDGFGDGEEIRQGYDPADSKSRPPLRYELVTGLGPYPENGGWLEVVSVAPNPVTQQLKVDASWLQVQWPEYTSVNGETRVVAGDIDGDNEAEMIVGLGPVPGDPSVPGGYFQVVDHDNQHMLWERLDWAEYNRINGETRPGLADIDGDGDMEILIGLGQGGGGAVAIYDFKDSKLVSRGWLTTDWAEYNAVNGETRPVGADVDGDGKDEIVVGLGSSVDGQISPAGFFAIIDDDLKSVTWGQIEWDEYNRANGETWPAAGDLNADGRDEIVMGLGSGSGGSFAVLEYENGEIPQVAWKKIDWIDYESVFEEGRPTVGNIDSDGPDEILVGLGLGGGGWMQAFDDANVGLQFLGSRRLSFSQYNAVNGESWPYYTPSLRSECSGDFDADGDVDNLDRESLNQVAAGPCTGGCSGDLDGDQDVDQVDFAIFEANFGRSDCSAPAPAAGELEPTTWPNQKTS
ncbi:MAG: hypothetical protein JSU96_16085 [Acidobacteriota bacterium]|nr:MAG: hypothetical protein JSU96_16085 [Acidobacteriota bacterium]